eukprot:15365654-Ditylum_brightwellii.AAC.1
MNSRLQAQTNSAGSFNLGAQTVRVSKGKKVFETKAIIHTLGKEQHQLQKSTLYKITNGKDRKKWTQTRNWRFIPFSPDGKFTIDQIVACVKLQNKFIGSVDNMAVTGFLDINAYVTNPKDGSFAPFRYCLLQEKAADGEPLIVSIEDGQPGVVYFVVRKHHKEEVEKNWSEPTENNGYAAAAIADLINKKNHKATLIDLTKDDVNNS